VSAVEHAAAPLTCESRTFHGVTVANPHAWLSAQNDPKVEQWAAAQHQVAGDFLKQCDELEPARSFLDRNHRPVDPVWHAYRGDRCFTLVRQAHLDHPLLCERGPTGAQRVLLDPNPVGLAIDPYQVRVSPSGRHIALQLTKPGEVLGTLQVLDTTSGEVIERSDFTTVMPLVAWHPSERGYYYSLCRRLFEEHALRDGVYWHTIGTPWSDDVCVQDYHDGPGHIAFALIPDAVEVLLLGTLQFSSGLSGMRLCELGEAPPQATRIERAAVLFEELESYNQFVGAADGLLYFHTCVAAANGRIVAVDPRSPARSSWRVIVPESERVLARPDRFGGWPKSAVSAQGLLVTYVEHAHDTLAHFSTGGTHLRDVEPPMFSTIDGVFAHDRDFRIFSQSFLVPRVVYEYGVSGGGLRELQRVSMPEVNPADYELHQVFFDAADGTRVPMYLLHRSGLRRDGSHPTLLYGYGGFSQSITPECSPEIALWLSLGGVYALANIRGGGEYGERWHAAGSRLQKQNTFDDFYAAAEYLIAGGYTSAQHLAARGISNGGLLTTVCANQRPELFAALVSEAPLADLMWLGDTATGQAVAAEYGSPAESPAMLEVMLSYSPLQNVRMVPRSPAHLVIVADQDRSARPGQAYQYVAARQQAIERSSGYSPVLLRIVRGEGHTDWPPATTRGVLAEEIAFLWHFASAGERAQLRSLRDVRMPVRDGVELSANVWLPQGADPRPAILLRTPYGNAAADFERIGVRAYVEAGYAVVYQSVRGRGASQGEFGFFFVEGCDGHDSVEWVAQQQWCNGKVAMDGGSYLGTVQWLAARERPPHLACILPAVPAGDWFNEIPYMGGALAVDFAFSWFGAIAGLAFDFDVTGDRNLEKYRPLAEAGRVLGAELPHYRDILAHPTLDDWWRRLYLSAQDFERIDLPVFAVTGWFDGDQAGSLYYWQGVEAHSPSAARAQLIVGPWEHAQCYLGGGTRIGELESGPESILPLRKLRLAFLDEHLRGVVRPAQPHVRLFITGSNRWHAFDRYPPRDAMVEPWYLCSEGRANTSAGDGSLSRQGPAGVADRFLFDPANPVPYKAGGRDHSEIERREDVLVYTSELLSDPVTVIGPVEALVHIASSATDTDFTAKLLDVTPDGRAISLTHVGGIQRARYRSSLEHPAPLVPGQPDLLRIRLSHVGHTFQPGHRVRLEISSSCFPLVDPNPNTGRDIATETEIRTATQTVLHDAEHPSHLLLPVWRR